LAVLAGEEASRCRRFDRLTLVAADRNVVEGLVAEPEEGVMGRTKGFAEAQSGGEVLDVVPRSGGMGYGYKAPMYTATELAVDSIVSFSI